MITSSCAKLHDDVAGSKPTTNSSSRIGWSGKVAGNVFSAAALVLMPISKDLKLTRVIYRYIWWCDESWMSQKRWGCRCYMLHWEPVTDHSLSTSQESTSQSFLLRDAHSSFFFLKMASRKDKPLLLSAMLGSKDELVVMRLFCTDWSLSTVEIEVEGVDENVKESYYSVSLYMADIKVAKSKKSKPQSSVVKLEWKENNQMWVVLWLCSSLRSMFIS